VSESYVFQKIHQFETFIQQYITNMALAVLQESTKFGG